MVTELQIHAAIVLTIFASAALAFVVLLRITAPYGRHLRPGWGPTLPARAGWVIMENPSVLLFAAVFAVGDRATDAAPLLLFALWQFHYLNRTFLYPLRLRAQGKRMPVTIVVMAIAFNCLNSYVNARWISHFGDYGLAWLSSAPFIAGVSCFLLGWSINQHADAILIRQRRPGESGYRVPSAGLYRWVSCPNYLGEILEWVGWAIATWSLAGTAFAVFTLANLLPRALANHRWYRQQFADYPPERRALVPFLL